MSEQELSVIRESTNKAWALGGDRFKAIIAEKTGRRSEPIGRGGDRKSEKLREMQKPMTLTLLILGLMAMICW